MSKARLIKRLQWYYPTERFNAFIAFPLLWLYMIIQFPLKDNLLFTYGMVVNVILLYQGQHYWKIKLHGLLGKRIDQEKELAFFRKSKKENQLLLLLMPLFFLIQLISDDWSLTENKMLLWGAVACLGGILEHINYYHRQLMIDNRYDIAYVFRNKRLKKASLAKDIDENKI